MVAAIAPYQLQLTELLAIGLVIGAIDVEAGDIEVYCSTFEPQSFNDLLRHHLIKRADIGLKEGIKAAAEHIIIEVIGTDPRANQAFYRLVGKELREHVQGRTMKAKTVQYHRHQRFTM